MIISRISSLMTVIVLSLLCGLSAADKKKPLKIYILAGQSNMQGQASETTFPAMAWDPVSKALHAKFVDESGKPRVYKDVHVTAVSQSGGWGSPTPDEKKNGPLTVGFGSSLLSEDRLGPELGFGVTMYEHVNQPILIIKTAWGGKSLHTNFRSPSSGPYYESTEGLTDRTSRKTGKVTTVKEQVAKKVADTGKYYRLMTSHVKQVLANPGKYHPAYDKEAGYEVAGFVWFQGFNDLVAGIYETKTADGKKGPKDFSLYSKLLAHFIRDVRQEFKAPQMPFVIGVIGVDGKNVKENAILFRKAMAAPAAMPEFKGNVVAVHTAEYWDHQLNELLSRFKKVVSTKVPSEGDEYVELRKKLGPLLTEYIEAEKLGKVFGKKMGDAKKKKIKLSPDEFKKLRAERDKHSRKQKDLTAQINAAIFTEEELRVKSVGRSSQGYHYNGSAKILGRIGEAFANALAKLNNIETINK
jgi:hypothetical protein